MVVREVCFLDHLKNCDVVQRKLQQAGYPTQSVHVHVCVCVFVFQSTPHGDKTLSQLVDVMESGLIHTLLHD